jgi:hypothetical protein
METVLVMLLGINVITVTNWQLHRLAEFDKVAKQLASYMDRRLRYKNPAFSNARIKLRKALL